MDIKNIKSYDTAYQLLLDNVTNEDWYKLTEEERYTLSCLDDYGPFDYAIINNDTVITYDGFSGDVVYIGPYTEWFEDTIRWVREEELKK